MRATTLVLLAGPALSNLIPRQQPSITPSPATVSVTKTVIAVTETLPLGSGPLASLATIPGCSLAPSIRRLLDSAPRPGTKLRSELADASITNYCDFAPTATLLSVDYSAYTSSLATWYAANSVALNSFEASFLSSCTAAQAAVTSAVLACVSRITSEAATATAAAGTGTTASTTNVTSTVTGVASTAGAAERTGLAAAAGAVAGMAALVAVL